MHYSLQGRTNNMLKKLVDKEVSSREKILEQWNETPDCKHFCNYFKLPQNLVLNGLKFSLTDLLDSYLDWLPPSMHQQVKSQWPPISKWLFCDITVIIFKCSSCIYLISCSIYDKVFLFHSLLFSRILFFKKIENIHTSPLK